jgi:dephospho-CoA kinase
MSANDLLPSSLKLLRTKEEFVSFNENNNASIILVNTPQHIRYSRIISRARVDDPVTKKGLLEMDQKTLEMGAEHLFSLAYYVIKNDGEFSYTVEQANTALEKILDKKNKDKMVNLKSKLFISRVFNINIIYYLK